MNPPDTYPSLPGTMTSNKASTIGVSFEAPTDGSGHPILTVNNFGAMPGAVPSSDATDPLPPTATLTKVDLVYPSGLAGTISLTQVGGGSLPVTGIVPIGSSDVRYWDSPTGGNLVAFPGQGINIDMASSSLTTLYAEAIGEEGSGPWAGGLMAVYNGPHSGWAQFVGTGSVADASWAYTALRGVSLSFAGAQPGNPDATVAVDPPSSSDGSSPGPQFTPLYLNLPAGLPNGTTVKISIDPALDQLINVYSDNSGAPASTALFGAVAGTTSYTWTVGSNNPPSVLDVESLGSFNFNENAFTLSVQAPPLAQPAPWGRPGRQCPPLSPSSRPVSCRPISFSTARRMTA